MGAAKRMWELFRQDGSGGFEKRPGFCVPGVSPGLKVRRGPYAKLLIWLVDHAGIEPATS